MKLTEAQVLLLLWSIESATMAGVFKLDDALELEDEARGMGSSGMSAELSRIDAGWDDPVAINVVLN